VNCELSKPLAPRWLCVCVCGREVSKRNPIQEKLTRWGVTDLAQTCLKDALTCITHTYSLAYIGLYTYLLSPDTLPTPVASHPHPHTYTCTHVHTHIFTHIHTIHHAHTCYAQAISGSHCPVPSGTHCPPPLQQALPSTPHEVLPPLDLAAQAGPSSPALSPAFCLCLLPAPPQWLLPPPQQNLHRSPEPGSPGLCPAVYLQCSLGSPSSRPQYPRSLLVCFFVSCCLVAAWTSHLQGKGRDGKVNDLEAYCWSALPFYEYPYVCLNSVVFRTHIRTEKMRNKCMLGTWETIAAPFKTFAAVHCTLHTKHRYGSMNCTVIESDAAAHTITQQVAGHTSLKSRKQAQLTRTECGCTCMCVYREREREVYR